MFTSSRRSRSLTGATAAVLGLAALISAGPLAGSAVAAPTPNVTGHVVGVGGAAIGRCSVAIESALPSVYVVALPDSSGAFSAHAPEGTYDVSVICWDGDQGFDALLDDVDLGGAPVDLGDITVAARVSVSGTVRDTGGAPVVNVEVQFVSSDGWAGVRTTTDVNGSYTLLVPPGAHRFSLTPGHSNGVAGATGDVTVGSTGESGLDFTLSPAGSVSGRVIVEGSLVGVGGAHVMMEPVDDVTPPAPSPSVTTATDGTFTYGGLGTGSYWLSVYSDGFTYAETVVDVTGGAVTSGVTVSVGIASGEITGTVSDAAGRPLPADSYVEVLAYDATNPEYGVSGTGVEGGTSAFGLGQLKLQGDYVLGVNRSSGQSLYTGRYFAGRGLLGAAHHEDATVVTAGEPTDVGQVRLDTCASVSGRVVDMAERIDRTPYDTVLSVAVFNDADPDLVTRTAEVNADGTFTVTGLLPGTYYAALRTSGYWGAADGWGEIRAEEFFGGVDPATDEPNVVVSACEPVSGLNFGVVPVPTKGDGVVAVTPVRLADDAVVPAFGQAHCAMVAGAGAPAGATGVMVNVASVSPRTVGNVVLFPDDGTASPQPPAAGVSVSFEPGRDVANAAFVKIGDNGRICWYSQSFATSRVVVDVVGFTMPESGIVLQESARLLDTRPGTDHVGELSGGLNRRQVYEVTAAGAAGVPADAKAVVLNVAVVDPAGPGHLRVYPADGSTTAPNIATVNYAPGKTKSNAALVPIGDDGKIALYSDTFSGTPVHVVLDVTGYVAASGDTYQTVTPERVLDTRPSAPAGLRPFGTLSANTVYSFDMAGTSVVPEEATGVVLNVTAIGPTTVGNLRVYPDVDGDGHTPPPNASAINYIQGRDIPNLVVVGIPDDGRVNFYSNQLGGGRVDLAVDVVGYTTGIRR